MIFAKIFAKIACPCIVVDYADIVSANTLTTGARLVSVMAGMVRRNLGGHFKVK